MQILENTSTKLAIYSRPIGLWLVVVGCPILGIFFAVELILQAQPLANKIFSLVLIICWICLAIGTALDLAKVIQCTLDKNLGLVTVKEQGLLGTKIALRSLSEVQDVLVDRENSHSFPLQPVSLVFSSGEKLPIYIQLESDNWQEKAQKTAEMIRSFLNLKGHS
jgi:hypothetical protein